MSAPAPFPPPPGLVPLGAADAGVCVDGVCALPPGTAEHHPDAPGSPGEADVAPATRG